VLINCAFNLSDHNTGLSKKKLAGILAGCIVFIVIILIILVVSIHRVRRKNLDKPGYLLVI